MKRFITVTALVLLADISQARTDMKIEYMQSDYSKQCAAANNDPSHPACCAQKIGQYIQSAESTLVGGPGSKSKARVMIDKAGQLQQANADACEIEVAIEAIMVGFVGSR